MCQFLLGFLDSVSMSTLLLTTHIAQPRLLLLFTLRLCFNFQKQKKGYGKVTLASYSLTIGFLNNLEMDVFWETTEG